MVRLLFGLAVGLACLEATPVTPPAEGNIPLITMPLTDLGVFSGTTAIPGDSESVVASPQMISSIQLSFDTHFDAAHNTDNRQIDLTLRAAMNTLEDAGKNFNVRSMGASDYVSFSLVNQVHVSTRPAVIEEEPEEEDSGLLEGKP